MLAICLLCAVASAAQEPTPKRAAELTNPASDNCVVKGGKLVIEQRGDRGEFGVCMFEDNRHCEEWALFRGECPVGGIKITGYPTAAARYCAITGGQYAVTEETNAEQEQGTCTLDASFQIPGVWIVDIPGGHLDVHREPDGTRYTHQFRVSDLFLIESATLPGLALDLRSLF